MKYSYALHVQKVHITHVYVMYMYTHRAERKEGRRASDHIQRDTHTHIEKKREREEKEGSREKEEHIQTEREREREGHLQFRGGRNASQQCRGAY